MTLIFKLQGLPKHIFLFFQSKKYYLKNNLPYKMNIEKLHEIIKLKSCSNEENSYTKKLINNTPNYLAQKIGEEGVEVAIAALDHDRHNSAKTRQEIINEVSDLLYHTTVLLVKYNINLDEIYNELAKRNQKND